MESKTLQDVAKKLEMCNLAKVSELTGISRETLRAIRKGGDCMSTTFTKLVNCLWR